MKRYIKSDVDISGIPEENQHGDCFVQALHTFMEDPSSYTLVHGVVDGQGPLEGIQYCHAWVEDGDYIIDKTMPPQYQNLPIDVYYNIGNIKITRKYDLKGVCNMVDKYETYGPWDKVFEKYP